MDTRITDRPAFCLVGHAARVPLIQQGVNPHIQAHIASLPEVEQVRLAELADTEPAGLLHVSVDVDPDLTEGSDFTYVHGVALDVASTVPDGFEVIEVPAGTWAVFRSSGSHPVTWGTIMSEWFTSNPWRLRPGPSMVAATDRESGLATTELWIPIEPNASAP